MTSQRPAAVPSPADRSGSPTARTGWWRDAVIYQVYPRSFADANGDGYGDLPGIRERLPYLRRLGVDAVWLSPFYASPQADGGYDVADYRAVDPMFGTLGDAEELVRDAHTMGLRVIVDIVPNHCSDQHEWFRQALREGPGSPMRERFHFRPGKGADGGVPPNDWESIFGGPAWTRVTEPDGTPGEWYLHLFAPEQPDFDWQHDAVHQEFRSILRFWLDLGVDGFRVDVAHGMVKAPGLPDIGRSEQLKLLGNQVLPFFDQDGVHEIYHEWRKILDEYPGERIAVAEAWTPTVARSARYLREDELHQAFNFAYLTTRWDATALREVIEESLDAMNSVGAPADLGAVQPRRRPAHHPSLRAATSRSAMRRARAATMLMLALPGSAYLYQGEELGLPEVVDLPDEVRQDPALLPGRRPGRHPRRLPGAAAVVRRAGAVRLRAGRRRPELAAAAGELGEAQRGRAERRPGLDAGVLPGRARGAPGASGAGRGRVGDLAGRAGGGAGVPPGRGLAGRSRAR